MIWSAIFDSLEQIVKIARTRLIQFATVFTAALVMAASLVSGDSGSLDTVLSSYRVYNLPDETLKTVASKFEITRRLNDKVNTGFEVIVPVSQRRAFLELAPEALLVERDISLEVMNVKFLSGIENGYKSFEQVMEQLYQLTQSHPDIAQLIEYGKTPNGHPLVALKLSDNVATDEDEPELMLTAATHGDEIITTEILLNLIDQLVAGYKVDPRLTKMIETREIYFIPVVNADGFVKVQRYDGMSDPNRSYPYPENPTARPTPSINALINFFNSRNFAGSIDFHAYGEMIMYPWAYTYAQVENKDMAIFNPLTQKMAQTNSYKYGPISKVIYVAKGSSADYYYWQKRTIAIAIEVGHSKAPHPSQIPSYTAEQAEATWRFIESFGQ
ncbi:MAG: M14 family zinc carboxypeptidase [Bdellovibrionota bacterium]